MQNTDSTLSMVRPAVHELGLKQTMMANPQTMAYNAAWGGTIEFPQHRWAEWHEKWVEASPADRFYRYLSNGEELVGEIAYYRDSETNRYLANVVIHAPFRGRGYGRNALNLLCHEAQRHGVRVLYDDIAADNPAIKLFLDHGFNVESRNEEIVTVAKALDAREA